MADRIVQGSEHAKKHHQSRARKAGTHHDRCSAAPYDKTRPNSGYCGRSRGIVQALIRHAAFDIAVALCILVNSAFIGFSAESAAQDPEHDNKIFNVIGNVFSFIFIFEFSLRFFAEGPWKLYCAIGCLWNWFDLVVVLEAVVDILFLVIGGDLEAGWSNLRALRFLKSIKLLRVLRVARIIQFTAAFRQFMHSTVVALRLLVWALLLLGLVVYMFAVFFTSAVNFQHPDWGEVLHTYYGSVGDSAMTLTQSILGGVSWREAVLPLRYSDGLYELVFLLYVCITYLTVLNVVTGVFTSVAIKTSEFDPDLLAISAKQEQRHRSKIAKRLFEFLDADESGKVTLAELESSWSSGAMTGLLKSLNINTHDSWLLFNLLDCDGDGLIEFEELCMGIQRLTGNAVQLELTRLHMGQRLLMGLLQNRQETSFDASRTATAATTSQPFRRLVS